MMPNQFVWYELATTDIDAALAFYGAVLGWQGQDFPAPDGRYSVVSAGGRGVGGVMALPGGMREPSWLGYVAVPDVAATVASFTASGGRLLRGPWEVPMVGKLALLSDPQRVGIAAIQGASERPSDAFDQQRPGHGSWHELHTPEPAGAFAFYAAQFGWTKGHAFEMGAMGQYQIFMVGEVQTGGMVKASEGAPATWLYYFGVADVHDALARVEAAGGTLLRGPTEVPGGDLIIHARDPQGAAFALVGPDRAAG